MPARARFRATTTAILLAGLCLAGPANAADFNPGAGTYTADTTALFLSGPGTAINGTNEGGVAVFRFDNVNIPASVTINARGGRPLKIVASGSLTLAGAINGDGASASDFAASAAPAGGPGGGAGGSTASPNGDGPGGGKTGATGADGAGGGGFGGAGARGASYTFSPPFAAGGTAYGDLNTLLQGGSGGGAVPGYVAGGGGGGAIALVGSNVAVPGYVHANGGGGAVGNGASGGGSGGGVVVHGDTVDLSGGFLTATGGSGGNGYCCGDGGGGGGGRIAVQYRTLQSNSFTSVSGGVSGAATSGGCGGCTDAGHNSPDAVGAAGVVTKTQAATATSSPATNVSASAADLNGSVNPHGTATTYHFEYGTTTGYGTSTADAALPGDSADHPVTQTIGGLQSGTTYHYRVVTTDGAGFVTRSTDIGFTTPAPPASPAASTAAPAAPAPAAPAAAALSAGVLAKWLPGAAFTRVSKLTVSKAVAGSRVTLTCTGKGCRFKKKAVSVKKAGTVSLTKYFNVTSKGRKIVSKLRPGAKVSVLVTKAGAMGKWYSATIRKGKAPKTAKGCLAPGSTTKKVACP